MILLYGRLDDPPLVRVLEALQEAGSAYLLLAQENLEHERLRLCVDARGIAGELTVAGQRVPLERIIAVYARPLGTATQGRGAAHAARLNEQLCAWLDVAGALVVNRPRAMQANASKPLQAQWIARSGFRVPETLISSDADEVHAFRQEHRRVVFKSISGIRSIVRELDAKHLARLPLLARLPTQFQAHVPGMDVRVHVVGERTFAAAIDSAAVDYRYAARDGVEAVLRPFELPDDVDARCVDMARQMELPLAGIDLRRRPDGEYVCFEVNPMPAHTYFEAQAGLGISRAVADLLIAAPTAPSEVRHGAGRRESDPNHRYRARAQAAPAP
jgi:hypothetical protein